MQFDSFEQALEICMKAEDGSAEQEAALVYCLQHAPDELKELIRKHHQQGHGAGGGCGCGHEKEE